MNSTALQCLGDFELIRELGRGGMGVVYEARQVSLNRKVALKVLKVGLGLTTQAVTRFQREAAAAAKLHHTNIVPIYATGEDGDHHFYAMELIEGPGLDQVIRRLREERENPAAAEGTKLKTSNSKLQVPSSKHQTPGSKSKSGSSDHASGSAGVSPAQSELAGRMPALPGPNEENLAATEIADSKSQIPSSKSQTVGESTTSLESGSGYFDSVARMLAEVADALDHAHKEGVIHRDIKPSNLMLSNQGRLHLTDFGLARVLEEPGMTVTGDFMGSPLYMSPEQIAAGRAPLDHRTDIYSLGATLYQMLTLQTPFLGERRDQIIGQIVHKEPKPPRSVERKVPPDLETICLKAMDKDPDRRYQTGGAMAEDLRRFVNRFAIEAKRANPVQRVIKWTKRHPAVAAALAGCVVLGLCAVGFAVQARRSQQELLAAKRQRALDSALAASMSGNLASAESAIKDIEVVGGSPGQVRMLRGLLAFQNGNLDAAIDELRQAVALLPNNVAARSLLGVVYNHAWRWSEYIAEAEKADRLAPVTPEDHLFKGYLLSFIDAVRALNSLNQSIRMHDTSMARAIRMEVRAMAIMDIGGEKEAEQLLLDGAVARENLPNHPYVLFVNLFARVSASEIYRLAGKPAKVQQMLEEARRDAQTLEAFVHLPDPALGLWTYWNYVHEERKVLALLDAVAERSEVPTYAYMCGVSHFREGETTKAAALLDKAKNTSNISFDLLRAMIAAEVNSNSAPAIEIYDAAMKRYTTRNDLMGVQRMALILGQSQRAMATSRQIRQSTPPYSKIFSPFTEPWEKYVCGEISDEELIQLAKNSRADQLSAFHIIAMRRLGEGDRAKAREYFQKATAFAMFGYSDYDFSRAILKRMEKDPTWPPWIQVKEAAR